MDRTIKRDQSKVKLIQGKGNFRLEITDKNGSLSASLEFDDIASFDQFIWAVRYERQQLVGQVFAGPSRAGQMIPPPPERASGMVGGVDATPPDMSHTPMQPEIASTPPDDGASMDAPSPPADQTSTPTK